MGACEDIPELQKVRIFARLIATWEHDMELKEFLDFVKTGKALNTPEIYEFMDRMSDEARKITFELNSSYHEADEVRELLSRLFGKPVDPTFKVFPPLYADFGKNITVGKNVFINACCHFQDHGGVVIGDGCQIGHNVVFATLDHGITPEDRRNTYPAPIVLGKRVWVGSIPSWRQEPWSLRTYRPTASSEASRPKSSNG